MFPRVDTKVIAAKYGPVFRMSETARNGESETAEVSGLSSKVQRQGGILHVDQT